MQTSPNSKTNVPQGYKQIVFYAQSVVLCHLYLHPCGIVVGIAVLNHTSYYINTHTNEHTYTYIYRKEERVLLRVHICVASKTSTLLNDNDILY